MMRRFGGPVLAATVPAMIVDDTGTTVSRWSQVETTHSSPNGRDIVTGIPAEATEPYPSTSISVVSDTYPSGDILVLGRFTFIEGIHYSGVNGDTKATATALAAAINATPGIEASVDGGDTSTVLVNLVGNVFGAYTAKVINKVNPPNLSLDTGGAFGGEFAEQSLMDPPTTS